MCHKPRHTASIADGSRQLFRVTPKPASKPHAIEDAEPQVRDWRFAELHTTDLAVLREVDVCIPFRLPGNGWWHPQPCGGPIMSAENGTTLLRRAGPLAKGLPGRDIPPSKVLTYCHRNPQEPALCSQSDNFLPLQA